MIPGRISKISQETVVAAATISPKSDFIRVTGTTAVATIVPPFEGFGGIMLFHSTDATPFTTVTTGNIALATTVTTGKLLVMAYNRFTAKWYPSY